MPGKTSMTTLRTVLSLAKLMLALRVYLVILGTSPSAWTRALARANGRCRRSNACAMRAAWLVSFDTPSARVRSPCSCSGSTKSPARSTMSILLSAISNVDRAALTARLEALVGSTGFTGDTPGEPSRWPTPESVAWEKLRSDLVVEVSYDTSAPGAFDMARRGALSVRRGATLGHGQTHTAGVSSRARMTPTSCNAG